MVESETLELNSDDKNSSQVLCVPSVSLKPMYHHGAYKLKTQELIDYFEPLLCIVPEEYIKSSDQFRKIVSFNTLILKIDNQLDRFLIRELRLSEKISQNDVFRSIGFGGCVRYKDIVLKHIDQKIDLFNSVDRSVFRIIKENIELNDESFSIHDDIKMETSDKTWVIVDDHTTDGQSSLGIVYIFTIDREPNISFIKNEYKTSGWKRMDEIIKEKSEYGNWSQMLVSGMFKDAKRHV